eukprot:1142927-Pelagomonas_calceolata.AAC.3
MGHRKQRGIGIKDCLYWGFNASLGGAQSIRHGCITAVKLRVTIKRAAEKNIPIDFPRTPSLQRWANQKMKPFRLSRVYKAAASPLRKGKPSKEIPICTQPLLVGHLH